MCLPSLTWAGPTVEELYAHHKKYIFGVRIDDERSKDTHTPEHKLQHDAQEHWQKVKAKLDKLLSRSVTSKEASLYHNYFKRLDLMRTETVLSGQLDMMMEGKVSLGLQVEQLAWQFLTILPEILDCGPDSRTTLRSRKLCHQ